MAATVSAWGKPGAWALDSEENEAELIHQQQQQNEHSDSSAANGTETAEFPSLAAAKTKKKQKKPQAISLHEFSAYGAVSKKPAAFQPNKGLTPDELFRLPTGPRERSAEELDRDNKLGGGFRSYGGGREEQPRRQGGSFNRDPDREFTPSRADETDDWGAGKKVSGSERRERGVFFGDSQSRADEVDNWASNKSFVASEGRRSERRGGFGLELNSGGSYSSNWGKRKEEEEGRKSGGAFDSLRERRGGFESTGVDSGNWGRKREEESGGSRPRLNLQPRTLPVVVEEQKSEIGAGVVKAKTSSNPFGEARPREEVLKEKGQDWKEIEEKLDSVKIKGAVTDGPAVGKRSFWSDKNQRPWRRPELVDSRPQSASESEGGTPENTGNGIAEDPEQAHSQM